MERKGKKEKSGPERAFTLEGVGLERLLSLLADETEATGLLEIPHHKVVVVVVVAC